MNKTELNKATTVFMFEFKRHLKLMIFWGLIFASMAVMLIALFGTIKEQAAQMTEVLKGFPPELLEAFGSDAKTLVEFKGYYNTKFLSTLIIINSIIGGYILNRMLVKELNDGSVFILFLKKIKRQNIFLTKFAAFVILLGISNLVVLLISSLSSKFLGSENAFYPQFFFAAFSAGFIVQILFSVIAMFVGLVKSEGVALFAGLALTLGSFMVDTLSRIPGVPEFVRYLTPFYYLDLNGITKTSSLKPENIIVLIVAIVIIVVFSLVRYRTKEVQL